MIELRTLGTCQIVVGDERIGPQSPYAFALALYLAIERGRRHSRDELLPVFFPGVPEANAAHSLRQNLYKLRQLGVPAETTAAGTIIHAAEVQDDYTVLLATGALPDAQAERLPGEFLPGYWPRVSDEFARWLDVQRDAVNSALRRAYVARILDRRAVARWDEVERFARGCLAIDPLNEEATLALAEALALSGSKAAGMKVLDRYLEEIGAEAGSLSLPASVLRRRISERYRPARVVGELPLIGREEESRTLHHALESSLSGVASSVWLHGEPGIGKTRLLQEFTGWAALSGARVVIATCQPQDAQHTLGVFYDVIPGMLELPGALGANPDALALLRRFSHGASPTRPDDGRDDHGTPVTSIKQLLSAISDLIDAVTAEVPLTLIIDDAHWLDSTSKQLLRGLLLERGERRFLLVVGSRDPLQHEILVNRFRAIRLAGLNDAAAADYVRTAVSRIATRVSDDTIRRAVEMAAGNPFFLRLLAEHLVISPESTEPPARLRELVDQRVRQTSRGARSILATCTVLGRFASIRRVEAVLEMPRYQLASGLAELESNNLLVADGDALSVSHSLIADSVLGAAGAAELGVIRRACAELLEDAAQTTGQLSLFWAAHDVWSAHGNASAARRCAKEAATLDALTTLMRLVDASAPLPADIDSTSTPVGLTQSDQPFGVRAGGSGSGEPRPGTSRTSGSIARASGADLLRVARDSTNSAATRLRASVAALAIAECASDAALATDAYAAAKTVAESAEGNAKADLHRAILAYHSVFGDQAEAERLASEIEAELHSYGDPIAGIRATTNAAEALIRCGACERGMLLLGRAFESALQASVPDKLDSISVSAYWTARQMADHSSMKLWKERSQSISAKRTSRSFPTYLYNEALAAMDESRWMRVADLLDEIETCLPSERSPYHGALIDAAHVRFQSARDDRTLNTKLVIRLSQWSLSTCRLVPEDDVALSVYIGLRHSFSPEITARDFLRRYTVARRTSSFPMLPLLKNAISEYE